MLSDALLRPDRFFRNRTTDPRVAAPLAIVLLLVAMRSAVALALPLLADGQGREPLASAAILSGLSGVPPRPDLTDGRHRPPDGPSGASGDERNR